MDTDTTSPPAPSRQSHDVAGNNGSSPSATPIGDGGSPGPETGYSPPVSESDAFAFPASGPFPIELLSPAVRGIVEATADVYGIDPALPAMSALAALSAAPGKSLRVIGAVSGRETYCNLFVIAGAPKSYGKNGAGTIVNPLIEESNKRAAEYLRDIRPKSQAKRSVIERRKRLLVESLADGKGSEGAPLTELEKESHGRELAEIQMQLDDIDTALGLPPTLWVGSYTSAALSQALARNGEALLCFSAEAGDAVRIALGRFSRDDKGDFDLFLSGYTVEMWNEGRVSRGAINIRPCLSVLWLCQPSVLREILTNEEALERGMTARCLMFAVEHDQVPYDDGVHREIPALVHKRWDDLIWIGTRIRELPEDEPLRLKCEPDAREVFRLWHNESVDLRRGRCRDIEGELGRWRESAVRIAAGVALADAAELWTIPESISADCARRAVEICRWAVYSTLGLMQGGRENRLRKKADRLERCLAAAEGCMTLRNLDHRHGFSASEVRSLAEAFKNRFRVISEKSTGRGRPSVKCQLIG